MPAVTQGKAKFEKNYGATGVLLGGSVPFPLGIHGLFQAFRGYAGHKRRYAGIGAQEVNRMQMKIGREHKRKGLSSFHLP